LELLKFGAIDIGSNAVRLLIARVSPGKNKEYKVKKVSLTRLPIRLGQEAFVNKTISAKTADRFLEAMKAFHHIINVHQVISFRAHATSAMRNASNGQELAERVFNETGIQIDIISGDKEANIIHNAHFKTNLDKDGSYVYVDVGGGSTEISILNAGEVSNSKSFKMGTVRLLNDMVSQEHWDDMKSWIREHTQDLNHIETIGSGGNINKLYKLTNKVYPEPMLYHELKIMRESVKRMSFEERVKILNLNPDRADVIGHASDIYYYAMKWSDSSIMHVPRIGLSDGIILELYNEFLNQKTIEA